MPPLADEHEKPLVFGYDYDAVGPFKSDVLARKPVFRRLMLLYHVEYRGVQELFKMSQYLVTIVVLVITSMQRKRENQGPEMLGIAYFREDR